MADMQTPPNNAPKEAQPQPGVVVMPSSTSSTPQPTPVAEPAPSTPFAQAAEAADPYTPALPEAEPSSQITSGGVSWTASEFIAHEKSASWYLGLVVAAAIGAFFVYIITRDLVSPAVVLVAALLIGIYGSHQPRQVEYRLDRLGVTVGGRQFLYTSFRSFSVIPEGAFSSIVFMPLKRFALPLTLYYAPDDEDNIMSVLADQLPLEHRKPDAVDSLMRHIRF